MIEGFVLITGPMAAGKSTAAQALAERLPMAAHVHGDVFRRFAVSGRVQPGEEPAQEAEAQLELRYRLSAATGDAYVEAGFTAVVQDIVIGEWLARYIEMARSRPLAVVVLDPSAYVITEREAGRAKSGYDETWSIETMQEQLATTPRLGLWLDTSTMSVEETVEAIEEHWDEAVVRTAFSSGES